VFLSLVGNLLYAGQFFAGHYFEDGRSTDVSYYSVLIISIPILSYYKARRPGSSSWNYLMDVENKTSYCPSMQGARDYFTSCVLLLW
jgi:hypothetical protein